MEYKFTKENFQEEVLDAKQPVLVDMFATWCGPCKMMSPVIEELAEEYEGQVKVGKVDIDADSELAAQYGIMSVPTFLVFKDGQISDKIIGAVPKEILKEAIDKVLKCSEKVRSHTVLYTLYKEEEKIVVRRLSGEKAVEVQDEMGLELR